MPTTDAQKRAVRKYDAANTKQVHLKLNMKSDADILEQLAQAAATAEGMQGYIKRLIREDVQGKRLSRPLPYLVEEMVDVDERGEEHRFPKYCPNCRGCFGLWYPPNVCPNCGQRIDNEHGTLIGTRTIGKGEILEP
jgi:hypothetical protein